MAATFATASELASHLQRDLDTASAVLALENASQQIRDEAGWSISEEAGVVATLDGTGIRTLFLPTQYLTAVTSVVEDGTTLTVVDDFDWTSYGRLIRAGCWTCKPRSIVVTYTHGYAAGSEKLRMARSVCLSLAGRIFDNPGGVRSYTVGSVSETFAGTGAEVGPLLGEAERQALSSYRLAGVA